MLLAVQFPIGWFMPDVHAGSLGRAMTLHISFGLTILTLILLRLVWRITNPVAGLNELAWSLCGHARGGM
jgi:cytochrome b561